MIDRSIDNDDDWLTVALCFQNLELREALRARGADVNLFMSEMTYSLEESDRSCSYPGSRQLTLLECVQERSDVTLKFVNLPVYL